MRAGDCTLQTSLPEMVFSQEARNPNLQWEIGFLGGGMGDGERFGFLSDGDYINKILCFSQASEPPACNTWGNQRQPADLQENEPPGSSQEGAWSE